MAEAKLYIPRPVPFEAVQWFKNGDHPDDKVGETVVGFDPAATEDQPFTYVRQEGAVVRYFRHPSVPGEIVHSVCGHKFGDHGWIDQKTDFDVCPGDFVLTPNDPTWEARHGKYYVMPPSRFHEEYAEWTTEFPEGFVKEPEYIIAKRQLTDG